MMQAFSDYGVEDGPNKEGSNLAARLDAVLSVQQLVSGAGALVNGPRFVHTLRWFKPDPDAPKFRLFQSHKLNSTPELALKLIEHDGVVADCEMLDPDHLKGKKAGRRSKARLSFEVLYDLYTGTMAPVGLDDLVTEAIARGILNEATPDSVAWRGRRRTIREHLRQMKDKVEARDGGTFAVTPEGMGVHE